jgi:ArsR family transcriptional regulator, cadmium/lead-responsive transcriptional repressor
MRTDPDDQLWWAIAEPSRRRVLDELVQVGEASASNVADRMPFSRQAVSKHLTVLQDAGLVTRRRDGREVRFQVDPDRLTDATRAMVTVAAGWDRRLQAIKRIAEAAHLRPTSSSPIADLTPTSSASARAQTPGPI